MSVVKTVFYGALARATGEKEVEVEASTLREVLDRLVTKYGDEFRTKVFDAAGNPRRFINIYVNGKDIRFLSNLDTTLKQGDKVLLIPAVSGG